VETDHKALIYLNNSQKYMILDWLDFLMKFNFYIVYQKSIYNVLSNKLSRLLTEPERGENELKVFGIGDFEVESSLESGVQKLIKTFIRNVIRKKKLKEKKKMKLIKHKHEKSYVRPHLLFMAMFREGWFWPSMRKMCEVESRNCEECLKYNVGRVGLHLISLVTAILLIDHVVIDFIRPLQTSEKKHNYVLLLVDIVT
jgi:hypothetical protein